METGAARRGERRASVSSPGDGERREDGREGKADETRRDDRRVKLNRRDEAREGKVRRGGY